MKNNLYKHWLKKYDEWYFSQSFLAQILISFCIIILVGLTTLILIILGIFLLSYLQIPMGLRILILGVTAIIASKLRVEATSKGAAYIRKNLTEKIYERLHEIRQIKTNRR